MCYNSAPRNGGYRSNVRLLPPNLSVDLDLTKFMIPSVHEDVIHGDPNRRVRGESGVSAVQEWSTVRHESRCQEGFHEDERQAQDARFTRSRRPDAERAKEKQKRWLRRSGAGATGKKDTGTCKKDTGTCVLFVNLVLAAQLVVTSEDRGAKVCTKRCAKVGTVPAIGPLAEIAFVRSPPAFTKHNGFHHNIRHLKRSSSAVHLTPNLDVDRVFLVKHHLVYLNSNRVSTGALLGGRRLFVLPDKVGICHNESRLRPGSLSKRVLHRHAESLMRRQLGENLCHNSPNRILVRANPEAVSGKVFAERRCETGAAPAILIRCVELCSAFLPVTRWRNSQAQWIDGDICKPKFFARPLRLRRVNGQRDLVSSVIWDEDAHRGTARAGTTLLSVRRNRLVVVTFPR